MHAVVVTEESASAAPVVHDWVAVLDDLASVSVAAVARAVAVLVDHPGVGIVFIEAADSTGAQRAGSIVPGDRWLRRAAGRGPDTVASRCAVLRRTTYELCATRPLRTRSGELSLWLRAAAVSDVAHLVDPLAAVHLEPSERCSSTSGQGTELHERAAAFRELFDGFAPLRGRDRLRAAAYRSIARRARGRAWVAGYEGDRVEAAQCRRLADDVTEWRRGRHR